MFKPELVSGSVTDEMAQVEHVPPNDTPDLEDSEDSSNDEVYDLGKQLEHNLAALFLKMQTVLHIPESSIQEVIQQLVQICELSQPLLHNSVKEILKQYTDIDDSTVRQSGLPQTAMSLQDFVARKAPYQPLNGEQHI